MKFCQARLSPPLIGQIVAEASLDASEEYQRDVYDEYVERRKCLIDGLNRIPGVYSPIPMGAFYTLAKLPVDDSEKFCRWCLESFDYEGETVMMAPASGFYTTPGAGINQVRIAYVLQKEDLERALLVLRKALEEYLDFRKCAEYGEFKNWYRGDLKMNIAQHLLDTYRRLGQTRNFS
jgi:aspartate aminotransferase